MKQQNVDSTISFTNFYTVKQNEGGIFFFVIVSKIASIMKIKTKSITLMDGIFIDYERFV